MKIVVESPVLFLYYRKGSKHGTTWGRSSVGRALHWQCRGHGFESHRLHSKNAVNIRVCGVFLFARFPVQSLFADNLPTLFKRYDLDVD